MALKNSSERYGIVAILFHWLMALMVIGLLGVGLYMTSAEKTPSVFKLYGLHKSMGAILLVLVCLRLLWRQLNTQPSLPETLPKFQRLAAHMAHYGLYFFMFAMPLSGWLMSSAAGFPVSVFGLFTLPNLVAPDNALRMFFGEAHELMAWALMALIVAHAGAALQHHFLLKDTVLRRMLPALLLMALLAVPARAAEQLPAEWHLIKEQSTLGFTATMNGSPSIGEFTSFGGEIFFEPEYPESASVRLTIDVGEIKAAYEDVAVTLRTADWFAADTYKQASFDASNFTKTGDNAYRTTGALTLRGNVVPVEVNFTTDISADGHTATVKGDAHLKRTEFGIGRGEWAKTDVVKDEVLVSFTLHATR